MLILACWHNSGNRLHFVWHDEPLWLYILALWPFFHILNSTFFLKAYIKALMLGINPLIFWLNRWNGTILTHWCIQLIIINANTQSYALKMGLAALIFAESRLCKCAFTSHSVLYLHKNLRNFAGATMSSPRFFLLTADPGLGGVSTFDFWKQSLAKGPEFHPSAKSISVFIFVQEYKCQNSAV